MQLPPGNGIFKVLIPVLFASLPSNLPAPAAKCLEMIAFPLKDSVTTTSISTVSSSGQKKVLPKIVPSAAKNGSSRIDSLMIALSFEKQYSCFTYDL